VFLFVGMDSLFDFKARHVTITIPLVVTDAQIFVSRRQAIHVLKLLLMISRSAYLYVGMGSKSGLDKNVMITIHFQAMDAAKLVLLKLDLLAHLLELANQFALPSVETQRK